MKWFVLTAPLWFASASLAQQATPPGGKGLVRMYDNSGDGSATTQFDREAWRKKLVQSDLDAREKAFDRLIELGTRTKGARESLEAWAKDAHQPELAWTARLALRQLDQSNNSDSLFAPGRWNDLQSRFDELQRRFDALGPMMDGMNGLRSIPMPTPAPGAESSQKSFSLQVGPDGVTCETTESVNGEEKKKTYKADSMDELLQAHPELRDQIGMGPGSMQWSFGAPNWRSEPWSGLNGRAFRWPQTPSTPQAPISPNEPSTAGSPPTQYLGIECTKPSPEKVKGLGLEPEIGLSVERAVPGTIADILGIQRGDILIELNGTPLYSSQDVSAVLRRRAADAAIDVVLIDKKGQRRTLTWKPTEKQGGSSTDDRDG